MNALIARRRSLIPPSPGFHRQRETIRSRGPFNETTKTPSNVKYFMPDPCSASPEKERKEDERPSTFLPENSKADFKLTRQESSDLENLLQWQASSSKSVIALGKPLDF
jgi:hypothetical protein